VDPDDRQRFETLYRANARSILAYALTRTSREDAQDVVANTFLVAWRRFDAVSDAPLPWLIGVARKVLADQRRSERRRNALAKRIAGDVASRPQAEGDVGVAMELRGAIGIAIGRLRPEDREIVTLVAWQGLTTEELATSLDCSKGLASLRLHRRGGDWRGTSRINSVPRWQPIGHQFDQQRRSHEGVRHRRHVRPESGEPVRRLHPANPVARQRIRMALTGAGVITVGVVVLVFVLVGSGTPKAFAAWTATTTTPPASQLATAAASCQAFFKDELHLGPDQGLAPALNTLPPLVLTDSPGPYELFVYAGPTGDGECVWDASGVLGVGN